MSPSVSHSQSCRHFYYKCCCTSHQNHVITTMKPATKELDLYPVMPADPKSSFVSVVTMSATDFTCILTTMLLKQQKLSNTVNNVSFDNFVANIYQDIRPSVSVRTVIISAVGNYRWELWSFQCFLSIHHCFMNFKQNLLSFPFSQKKSHMHWCRWKTFIYL